MCLGSLSCRKVKLLPSLHWGENWVWPHRHKAQIGGVLQWCLGFSHLHIWSWSSTRVTIGLLVTSLEKALLHQLLSLARRPALGRVLVVPKFFHGNRDYMLLWTFNTADFFPLNSSSERCLDTILFLSSTGTPFDLRTLRTEKHLQIKNTTSSILQHMHCKCSQHNQIKKRAANKIIYLCCEHLHHLLSNWLRCFLDLQVLFLFACAFWSCSALSSLGHRINVYKHAKSKSNTLPHCKMKQT